MKGINKMNIEIENKTINKNKKWYVINIIKRSMPDKEEIIAKFKAQGDALLYLKQLQNSDFISKIIIS